MESNLFSIFVPCTEYGLKAGITIRSQPSTRSKSKVPLINCCVCAQRANNNVLLCTVNTLHSYIYVYYSRLLLRRGNV